MKKLFFLFVFFTTLFVSCNNSDESLPSGIIIQDDMLNPQTVQRIKELNVPDGYQILIEKVGDVEKGKISKFAKKYYKQLQNDGIARTDAVLILYIENCKMLVSRMPENLRNYIDNKYPEEYFNAQIIRDGANLDACVESMLKVVRRSIYEYENLSVWRKNAISENIFALTDAVFTPVLPSDSWVFKLFFYIPLSIVFLLFGMTGSLHGSLFILSFVAVLLRIIIDKFSSMRTRWFIFILMLYMVVLPMLSSYILALPRYEHICILHAFGYNAETIDALQSFYANYSSLSNWFVVVLFCAVVFVKSIVSNVEYVVYGLIADSSIQRKIYEKNATEIAYNRNSSILKLEYMPDVDNDDYPYNSLFASQMGNALARLPFVIILGLMMNTNLLYIISLICCIQLFGCIYSIVQAYNSLKNNGVSMIF
ncbi:MAG: hypothetical protein KH375_06250 [Alistipes sp.]|nr:hypothetical protein [Alistipes sp.]